jgi:hypothetical protein
MAKYEVTGLKTVVFVNKYIVEADTEEAAFQKVVDGDVISEDTVNELEDEGTVDPQECVLIEEVEDEEINEDDVIPTIEEGLDGLDPSDLDVDNEGKVLIYTSIYKWSDGTFHTTAEPATESEDE